MRSAPRALVALLVVALLIGLAWTVAAAPLTGPDEWAHFAYIQSIAETGNGPDNGTGTGNQSTEVNEALAQLNLGPILGHPEGRPAWAQLTQTQKNLNAITDAERANTTGPNSAGSNPPLYYILGVIPYELSPSQSLLGRIYAVRLMSVLFFVITVLLAWLIAAELFVRTWPRVLATSMVVFQPKLGFAASLVNPDIMIVMLSTGCILAGLRIVRHGLTTSRALAVTLTAGAAFLTHGRGVALVPVAAAAIAYGLWRLPQRRHALIFSAAIPAALLLACGVLAYGYTRSHAGGVAYGGQTNVTAGFNLRGFLSYVWQFYLPKFNFMTLKPGPDYGYRQVFIDSYYSAFGALDVYFKPTVLDGLQIAAMLGLVGLYTAAVARWRLIAARWAELTLCAIAFLAMMAVLHLSSYVNLKGGSPVITGRYLLPCVALYGCAAAFVISSLPRRLGALLGGALVSGSAVLALGAIGLTAARYYS